VTTTISASGGGGSTSPTLVLGYQAARRGRNIIHDLIGDGIAVTLIGSRLRSGTLALLYPAKADAFAAEALLASKATFTLTDTDVAEVGMSFVTDGDVTVELDDATRDAWVVSVDFQQVES
tara:strand:- start:1463 stop:1825 length:363 start_codon:yes stop_codon:yes gene_type:complete